MGVFFSHSSRSFASSGSVESDAIASCLDDLHRAIEPGSNPLFKSYTAPTAPTEHRLPIQTGQLADAIHRFDARAVRA